MPPGRRAFVVPFDFIATHSPQHFTERIQKLNGKLTRLEWELTSEKQSGGTYLRRGHGAGNDFVQNIRFLLPSDVDPNKGRLHVR